MNKFLQKVAKIFLGLSMAAGVGVAVSKSKTTKVNAAVGDEIKAVGNIVSGAKYYIKGLKGSAVQYLSFTDAKGNSVAGTGVSSTSSAQAVTFTQKSSSWYITTESGLYLTPASSNGKLILTESETSVALSNGTNTIKIKGASYYLQKNKSANNFGGYNNTQNDVTLIVAAEAKTLSSITLGGTYPTTFTVGDTFDHTGMTVTAHYSDSTTGNVTSSATWSSPDMTTSGSKQITVSYGGKSATYNITVNDPRTVTGLTVYAVHDEELNELADEDEITLTASSGSSISTDVMCEVTYSPSGSDGNVSITSASGAGFSFSTEDDETYTLTFTANGNHVITFEASEDDSFAITVTYIVSGLPNVITVTDTIDNALTDVGTGTTYETWSGKSDQSDAVYAGKSAGGNTTVQLRTSGSDEGVVTTHSSGGVATVITLTFNNNTADSRRVDVYGKNTAYSAASDLFNASNQGTLIGYATYDKNGSGETVYTIDVSSDETKQFSYIGIRSNNSALYLDSIEITWSIEQEKEVVAFSITGSIGDTPRNTDYDLTGLQLHAWYDSEKTDEASSAVAGTYELVAVPTTAGSSVDPNNKISVQVYLKTDTSHTNCLATFTNVAAPIVTDPKGSVNNPYTASEAKEIATAMSSGDKLAEKYVLGIISQIDTSVTWSSSSGYKSFWISDDGSSSNQYKMYHSYYLAASQKMTEEQFNSLKVGDRVLMCGTIERWGSSSDSIDMDPCFVYQHTQNELNSTLVVSGNKTSFTHGETLVLGNNLSITASYAVSGNKTVDVSEVTYTLGGTAVTTPVELDAAIDNGKQVVITYTDAARGSSATYSYSISVVYADVSSVVLTEHNVTVEPTSTHDFTATLNSGVNPSKTVSWTAVNDDGSLIPTANIKIESTGNLTAKLTLTAASNVNGAIIVTATCEGHSDTCSVRVTGDPYVTFDVDSVKGIVGTTINNTVTATPVGLGTPTGYTWSIKSGSPTDIVTITSGSATSTVTFNKAGSTVIHVVITDGNKNAVGDIDVNVLESLNDVTGPGGTQVLNETLDLTTKGYTNAQEISTVNSTNFALQFDKGTNSNTPKYYSNSVDVPAVRVYGGGTMTVSSSKTITQIVLTFGSSDGSNAISTDVGNYNNGTWTGSSSEVVFTVGGSTGNRRFSVVEIQYETTGETVVTNTDYQTQKAILDFVEEFNDNLDGVCKMDGSTSSSELSSIWGSLAISLTSYRSNLIADESMSQLDRQTIFDAIFTNAKAAERDEYGETPIGDSLEKALAKYNWIVSHYAGCSDFISSTCGRSPVQGSSQVVLLSSFVKNTNTIAIIVIISMVSMTAIGGYFFLRKRKENI